MRMVHYYAGMALFLAPCLVATAVAGLVGGGTQGHLLLGLVASIACVATQTLLILFMIVTGRVLKAAIASRSLPREFLDELNLFFARRRAYPLALLGAVTAVATAVLGYGSLIGVPSLVHVTLGLGTVVLNLVLLPLGLRTLRSNQDLLDRVARELDRIDAERSARGAEPIPEVPVDWAFSRRARWFLFAVAAWLPYVYWGLVVWRGRFGEVPPGLPVLCALLSGLGIAQAFRSSRA